MYNCYNIFHSCNSGNKSNKTFKPRKNIDASAASTQDLMKHAAATLGSGNLRLAVMLPEGEDINEWVAVNSELETFEIQPYKVSHIYFYYFLSETAVDFFNQINMLYGTITEFCTDQTCPIMSAGAKYK